MPSSTVSHSSNCCFSLSAMGRNWIHTCGRARTETHTHTRESETEPVQLVTQTLRSAADIHSGVLHDLCQPFSTAVVHCQRRSGHLHPGSLHCGSSHGPQTHPAESRGPRTGGRGVLYKRMATECETTETKPTAWFQSLVYCMCANKAKQTKSNRLTFCETHVKLGSYMPQCTHMNIHTHTHHICTLSTDYCIPACTHSYVPKHTPDIHIHTRA